jgi:hypothetical protein
LDAQAELTITTNTQAVLFDMPIALFRARWSFSALTCLGFMHFPTLDVAATYFQTPTWFARFFLSSNAENNSRKGGHQNMYAVDSRVLMFSPYPLPFIVMFLMLHIVCFLAHYI